MTHKMNEFIQDLECLQDESNECGDLEDRLEIMQLISDQTSIRDSGEDVIFSECSNCKGEGKHKDYEDEWMCRSCLGLGGKWIKDYKGT